MKSKDVQEKLVQNNEEWMEVENATILATDNIAKNTDNPLIKLVMEIIKRDSQMHHKVQKFINDSIQNKAITISPDELSQVWTLIEKHIEVEKTTIRLGNILSSILEGQELPVQQYLAEYLLIDEKKHDMMMANLEQIKKGMYP